MADDAATIDRSMPDQFDRVSLIDPAALMRIKNLQLRAKVVVDGFYNGLHRSPFHGFSVEFSEYRQYTPGDDPRYLDWKLFARSDRYYIKRFEDETNRRCHLLLDISRSMEFASITYTKAEYARTLAATLAYYLTLQRDSVGLLTFDNAVAEFITARSRPGHLHHLLVGLERASQGNGTDLNAPLEQIASFVSKRGLIIFISDLLAPVDSLQTNLGYLRSRGHDVLLIRILDPAEIALPLKDASVFLDLESKREMYVDPETSRSEYRSRFQAHDEQVQTACTTLGIDYTTLLTDQPLEQALFDLLAAQLRQGRVARRHLPTRHAQRGHSTS
ncbi:MAG: DUF58 domain-containing protein [Pirellulaceae bacterium]|nr:DUF58 domain-containing protein [Pirellulaceae bacterium]